MFLRNIGPGSWGPDVGTLQQILNDLGYNIKIDSNYGESTTKAVKDFQMTHVDNSGAPLVVDGIVGEKTWRALTTFAPVQYTQEKKQKTTLVIGLLVLMFGYFYLSE